MMSSYISAKKLPGAPGGFLANKIPSQDVHTLCLLC